MSDFLSSRWHYFSSTCSLCLFDICTPLREQPHQGSRTDYHRPRNWKSPPCRLVHHPLRREMRKSNEVHPDCQLIPAPHISQPAPLPKPAPVYLHCRIRDVVSCIQPYDRSEKRPCAKCAARQRCDVLWCRGRRIDGRGIVDARREFQCRVGLDGVADGD